MLTGMFPFFLAQPDLQGFAQRALGGFNLRRALKSDLHRHDTLPGKDGGGNVLSDFKVRFPL